MKQPICTAILFTLLSTTAFAKELALRWNYLGEEGPAFWHTLDDTYRNCHEGFHQSPINLSNPIAAQMQDFQLSYTPVTVLASNPGYTLVADFKTPGNSITLKGETFPLIEMHFHQPAEHPMNGKIYPLEAHFVHINADGAIIALGVFLEEGPENPGLKALVSAFKTANDTEHAVQVLFNPNDLQPPKGPFYRYEGSLTTPPCREGVTWLVQQTPITLSSEQLAMIKSLMETNARPVQKMHARMLLLK